MAVDYARLFCFTALLRAALLLYCFTTRGFTALLLQDCPEPFDDTRHELRAPQGTQFTRFTSTKVPSGLLALLVQEYLTTQVGTFVVVKRVN